jgi:putative membrane protein
MATRAPDRAPDRPPAPSAAQDADAREAATPAPERSARWGRVVGLFVVLAGAFLIYDSARALLDVWRTDWVGGTLLSLLALAFLAALGRAVVVEVRALRRLAEVDRVRARLERALSDDRPAKLNAALDPVLSLVGSRRPDLVKAFRQRRRGLEEPQAVLKQFRGAVLTPLDQEARRVVRANALAVMGATAISPHPALDVAIVLWRSAVMVRRVAEVYGLRPSALSTALLVRQTVVSAAIAVAADPTGDMVATTLGGGLAEKVSARFAEGSISGLRALRLGGRAIEVCRPLPFLPAERKGLWHTLTQG